MKHLIFVIAMTTVALCTNLVFAGPDAANQLAKAEAVLQKVSVNSATLEQLDAIPGLGKKKAQAVIDHIAQHGPMQSEADLVKVKGIGEKLAAKISPYLSFK